MSIVNLKAEPSSEVYEPRRTRTSRNLFDENTSSSRQRSRSTPKERPSRSSDEGNPLRELGYDDLDRAQERLSKMRKTNGRSSIVQVMPLEDLFEEKAAIKRELKTFDLQFHQLFGRMVSFKPFLIRSHPSQRKSQCEICIFVIVK